MFQFTSTEKQRIQMCHGADYCLMIHGKKFNSMFKKEYNRYDLNDKTIHDIQKISDSTLNGFILKVEFKKDDVSLNGIIKCAKTNISDNLIYEYLAGKTFINELIFKYSFSCFVQTHAMFKFTDEKTHFHFASKPKLDNTDIRLLNQIIKNPPSQNWCDENKHIMILIQYIPGITLYDYLTKTPTDDEFYYNLIGILAQVYFSLHLLRHCFTHHDLHVNNIIISE